MISKLKYLVLYVPVFCVWATAHAQNLVPNWSFEEFNDSCTNQLDPGMFENVKGWFPKQYIDGPVVSYYTYGTPDYYSSCNPYGGYHQPNLIFYGYQNGYEGNSFAGIGLQYLSAGMAREAIRIELLNPLIPGMCYHAEFYTNKLNDAGLVHNKLGMVLTTDRFSMQYDGSFPYPTPQVYTNEFIYDTLDWVKIEGNFTASGGEKWLTIGWMFDSTQIAFDSVTGVSGTTYSYYYIDAVKVYPCSDDEEAIKLPNLITPNGDGKNDVYSIDSLPAHSKVSFFNRWGNEIYRNDNYLNEWNGTYNGQLLPVGTYYVVVQMPQGTKKSTFVELMY